MGAFKWLLDKRRKVEFVKSSWHRPLHIVQRCHRNMIRYNTYVHNSLTEKAQLEHVRSERDTHFVQEEELLTHMRLLCSEAKDWKSRVVSEAKQVFCRESTEAAHRATEVQKTMDKQFQARWRQAEAELRDLCKSNSAQVQSLAAKLHEDELEHQQLNGNRQSEPFVRNRSTGTARPAPCTDRNRTKPGPCWFRGCAVRSRPGKPNQRKGQNDKFMNFAHFFVWILVFFLRKTSTIHIELSLRNAPAKSSWTDLSLVWFAGATPDADREKVKHLGVSQRLFPSPFSLPLLTLRSLFFFGGGGAKNVPFMLVLKGVFGGSLK